MPVAEQRPILIVDDDEPTQKLLEALMKRQGLATRIVSNGAEAIDCLREEGEFACVILDLMMPSADGRAVIHHLANGGRRVPVIVCTAAGVRSTDGLDSGVVRAIVRKPFDIDELAAIVTAVASNQT